MQILQTNYCTIITPGKAYDLQIESDGQFTDMKFMFSRYELKTITKRLVRGRNQSASEGKFMGCNAIAHIIPTSQHILEIYDVLTIAEKNRLWKLVLKKATVYRSQDDKLTVNIYPNLSK